MIPIKYLRSNHVDPHFDQVSEEFLQSISTYLPEELVIDPSSHISPDELKLLFIASGGTEEVFLREYAHTPGPIYLLTMPKRNSLAAAMEILSWMKQHHISGEILHGSPEYLAGQILNLRQIEGVKRKLSGLRLGVTEASDWLIASGANYAKVKSLSGIEFVPLDMQELRDEIDRKDYPRDTLTEEIQSKRWPKAEIEKALHVYGGVRRIADKHNLQGISIKCFDLLEPYQTSGCLALALLNAAGYHAACEGDELSLLSMAVLGELTKQPVFMANPARLDFSQREIVFAHCVLPLSMPENYHLMTHYESGIGVAIQGDLTHDRYTVFKMADDFKTFVAMEGTLVENLHEADMCRTQIKLRLDDDVDYFLKRPIANHHMIVRGEHKALLEAFFHQF